MPSVPAELEFADAGLPAGPCGVYTQRVFEEVDSSQCCEFSDTNSINATEAITPESKRALKGADNVDVQCNPPLLNHASARRDHPLAR